MVLVLFHHLYSNLTKAISAREMVILGMDGSK